jgi:type I restriction enzyme S subunit
MSFPRYPAYKDSGVEWLGDVPGHWPIWAIKRIASLRSGDMIGPESIFEAGPYPVYGGNGLRGYTSDFTHEGSFALIGRQGALCGNVNYAAGQFWASEHAVVVSPKQPLATKWIGEMLRTMNLGQLPRDNQDETGATIRMRNRRRCRHAGKAEGRPQ